VERDNIEIKSTNEFIPLHQDSSMSLGKNVSISVEKQKNFNVSEVAVKDDAMDYQDLLLPLSPSAGMPCSWWPQEYGSNMEGPLTSGKLTYISPVTPRSNSCETTQNFSLHWTPSCSAEGERNDYMIRDVHNPVDDTVVDNYDSSTTVLIMEGPLLSPGCLRPPPSDWDPLISDSFDMELNALFLEETDGIQTGMPGDFEAVQAFLNGMQLEEKDELFVRFKFDDGPKMITEAETVMPRGNHHPSHKGTEYASERAHHESHSLKKKKAVEDISFKNRGQNQSIHLPMWIRNVAAEFSGIGLLGERQLMATTTTSSIILSDETCAYMPLEQDGIYSILKVPLTRDSSVQNMCSTDVPIRNLQWFGDRSRIMYNYSNALNMCSTQVCFLVTPPLLVLLSESYPLN
jgi:hypothetical protein